MNKEDLKLTIIGRLLGIQLFFRLYWKRVIAVLINIGLIATGIAVLKLGNQMLFSHHLYNGFVIVITVMFGIACLIYGAFGIFVALFKDVKVGGEDD